MSEEASIVIFTLFALIGFAGFVVRVLEIRNEKKKNEEP